MAATLLGASSFANLSWAKEQPLRPWPGTSTPPLRLTGLDGKDWDLASLRGKVVVLNFWASWCGPCVDELPVLNELAAASPDGLVVVGVNFKESADAIARFTQRHAFSYPILRDKTGDAFKQWTSGVMPTTILIGKDGRARWRLVGELDPGSPALRKAIEKMLQQ
jgi:thiol-disulfide isomerase/thioredoxin